MAVAVITTDESPKFSLNLFPEFAGLTDIYNGWNILFGSGSVLNSTAYTYAGEKPILMITNEENTVLNFNSGNSGFEFTAPKTGMYIFATRVLIPASYSSSRIFGQFDVYINESGSGENQFKWDNENQNFQYDKWNTFFQYVYLGEGDVYSLGFRFWSDTAGSRAYMAGFKVELDDRGLVVPSRYTFPLNTIINEVVQITIPEILDGASEFVTATLTGASVGDIVQMILPTDLSSIELVIGYPQVTATNTVRLSFTNNSGSTIAEIENAEFTFKIVK